MKCLHGFLMAMETHKPYLAMLFIQFVYAGMAMFSKASINGGMNPFVFVVYRQAFGSLALAPFALFLERKAPPLSYDLVGKIFLVALCGITLSLNLYYVALNYTSATFAAATTNIIPAITFIMAVFFRMESISIKHLHGMVKVLGSVVCVSGALVYAFVKGPPIKFMNWYPSIHNEVSDPSVTKGISNMEWVKGSLIMLSGNTAWSLWLVLQGPIIKRYPAKLRLTTLQCFFSCIQSAILAIVVERNPSSWKIGWDVHLLSVVYCGIIVTAITYWLQVWSIEKKGPVFTAVFTPLALLITAIMSAFLWKERLHWGRLHLSGNLAYEITMVYSYDHNVGGAVLLVGGLYCVLWGKNKEEAMTEASEQRQETNGNCIVGEEQRGGHD
ncbi:hypothetical protein HHK36_004189 [Tetracentron sinense]|uniref:WAT1-related protein n=1 Tax=Tetracentron sinense TaxID=13715 RepID=A0A835DQ19_TETSI|nr:hypothetical protein HHK36_004189 [Tetracentron sinense]